MADSDEAVVGEEQEAPTSDLGKTLQEARESRDLSIEEISTELRIEARLLRALEANRYEEIGAPVFAKGYLKQYGARLGLDYGDLLSEYYRIVGSTEVQIAPSRVIKLRDERQVTVWVIAALVIALLAIVLVVWWIDQPDLGRFGLSQSSPSEGLASPPAAAEPLADVSQAAFASSVAGAGRAGVGGLAPPEAPPESNDAGAPGRAAPEPSAAELAAAVTLPAVAEPVAPPPNSVSVELTFAADCWTEVTDGTGERHFYGLAEAGAHSAFYAVPPISFLLGDADGVEISINGRSYPIPGSSRQGALARFSVDAFDD